MLTTKTRLQKISESEPNVASASDRPSAALMAAPKA